MICPGCERDIDNVDPMKMLAGIFAHELFCRPPGITDMILARSGHYTRAFSMWAGRSIETMAGASVIALGPDTCGPVRADAAGVANYPTESGP